MSASERTSTDTVFLGGVREAVDKRPERLKLAGLGVHLGAPVRRENVREVAYIHRGDPFGVEPLHQVPNQGFLCVVAPSRPFAIQPPYPLTAVSPFAEFGLYPCDFFGRLAEAVEQVPALAEILLAGRGSTGNKIVRAHVQRGFFRSQW